jgi:hypothetical protein
MPAIIILAVRPPFILLIVVNPLSGLVPGRWLEITAMG